MDKIKHLIGKMLCFIGYHKYQGKPILANLDTYWMQGGEQCTRCRNRRISFNDASILAGVAYERGKLNRETKFLAYGNGVKDIVKLYGKSYVQRILDDMVETANADF